MTITCLVPVDYQLIAAFESLASDRTMEDVIRQALVFASDNREFWIGGVKVDASAH